MLISSRIWYCVQRRMFRIEHRRARENGERRACMVSVGCLVTVAHCMAQQFILLLLIPAWNLVAQDPIQIIQTDALRPFGLQGRTITSLTTETPQYGYPYFPLVASTDGEGTFITAIPGCPHWNSIGLTNKVVRSITVQHNTWGPELQSFIFAGGIPDLLSGDSTLVYRMEYYWGDPWMPVDSGVDRGILTAVNALDAFYVDLPMTTASGTQAFSVPVIMGGQHGLYYGYDTFARWEEVMLGGTVSINDIDIPRRRYGNEIFAVGSFNNKGAIFRSIDRGITWSIDSSIVSPDTTLLSVVVNDLHIDTVFIGSYGRVLMSTDSGRTFKASVLEAPDVEFRALAIDTYYHSDVFAGGITDTGSFAFFHSRDGGLTWSKIEPLPIYRIPGVTSITVNIGDFSPDDVYIGTLDGVWQYALNRPHDEDTVSWTCSEGGWNLVSVPQKLDDYRKSILFPNAISDAYTYEDYSYQKKDTLLPGKGYWIKFLEGDHQWIEGNPILDDTVEVRTGWNLIGSISRMIDVTTIEQSPPGLLISDFLDYDYGYRASSYLVPLRAYWIKASQNGTLRLKFLGK